jgi:hypothetical protein
VEFAGADDAAAGGILEGRALELAAGDLAVAGTVEPADGVSPVAAGEGSLAPDAGAGTKTAAEGEPL